ncbi:glycosyltransferase [Microbacterium paraoxydans]|uniref:glycosyltransferase n=1 Tax=Microbacterium paraoxydans TaxID=199592 RepID=UPI001CFBF31E|nr:glycosyltransferase [Microbacterium paraoxydans]
MTTAQDSPGGRSSTSSSRPIMQVFSALDRGGAELRTIDILRASGTSVQFLAASGRVGALDETLEREGHTIHRLRVRGPVSAVKAARLIRRQGIEVVHAHLGGASGMILVAAWAGGARVRIAHSRSDGVGGRSTPLKRTYLALSRALVRVFATDIVGVSPSALEGSGLLRGKWRTRATVIPNGLDAAALRLRAEQGRGDREEAEGTLVVASVARAEPAKNRMRAIRVWSELARGTTTTLRLIGGLHPSEREEADRVALFDHVAATGSRIEFVGETVQVAEEIGASDVLLVTSMREGLPGVVLESLACGTPVVSTDLPGVQWIAGQVAGVSMLSLDAKDRAWAAALEAAPRDRDAIARSFADSRFQLDTATAAHLALWRMSGSRPFPRVLKFFSLVKLHRDESGAYRALTPLMSNEEWAPFLEVFDRVEIFTRVEESVVSGDGYLLDDERIRVTPLPFYDGWRSYFRQARRIRTAIDAATRDNGAAYGVWAPNQIVAHVARRAKAKDAELLVRLIGDPEDVLTAIVPRPFGAVLGRFSRASTAAAVRKATAVVYVTLRALQAKYPAATGTAVLARTNLRLSPEILEIEKKEYADFLAGGPVSVIAVGSQQQNYKGHDLLIDAVAALRRSGREVNLTLVGQGALHSRLVDQAELAGVPVNFVPRAGSTVDVARLVVSHDILVMPSRTEGMPKALLEAMSVGVFTLGSSVGGMVEVLDSSFRFEPDDTEALAKRLGHFIDHREDVPAAVEKQRAAFEKIWHEHSGAEVMQRFLTGWSGHRDA